MSSDEEDKDNAIARLVANITHELKTPLHSILAVTNLLESEADGSLNAEQQKQVAIIRRNGESLLEQITELLHFSSTVSNTRPPDIRRVDVAKLINEIVTSVRPVAKQNNISINFSSENLAPTFATDKQLLERVIGNLLGNAIKFSQSGEQVSLFISQKEDKSLYIQITDSGIGMDNTTKERIFSDFFQAEAGDTRRFSGVGLGLSLVKNAMTQLNGTIEVQSEEGQGSLFTLLIPEGELREATERILAIVADSFIETSLRECLSSQGYKLRILSNEKDLILEVAEDTPDLIVIDIVSDGENGYELLTQIRHQPWGQSIPVLIMSSYDNPEQRALGFSMGADDFIAKPFNAAELVARVRLHLDKRW